MNIIKTIQDKYTITSTKNYLTMEQTQNQIEHKLRKPDTYNQHEHIK